MRRDRRFFIIGIGLIAAVSFSFSMLTEQINNQNEGEKCIPTSSDILGPYFRDGAPIRNNVRRKVDVNNLLVIEGIVCLDDCKTPLKYVYIDFWHANSSGWYDNDSKEFYYRAKVKTDRKGRYRLKTILPGRYMDDTKYRPRHINFKVKGENTEELISQIYFNGDPYINSDPWASKDKAVNRIVGLQKVSEEEDKIEFNIILRKKKSLNRVGY